MYSLINLDHTSQLASFHFMPAYDNSDLKTFRVLNYMAAEPLSLSVLRNYFFWASGTLKIHGDEFRVLKATCPGS